MSVTAFQDLPVADRDREWDGSAAEKRVRSWADATDEPNQKYRDAHVWYDHEKKDNFTAYKLLIADVVDGELRAVPRGVIAAAAVINPPVRCRPWATASVVAAPLRWASVIRESRKTS